MAAEKFPQSIKCEISPVQDYLKEKSDFQESYATLLQENDDMTQISDNSDSGFTDFNQTNSTQQKIGPLPEEATKQPEPSPEEDKTQHPHQLTTRSESSTSSLLSRNSNSEFPNEPEIGLKYEKPDEDEDEEEEDENDDDDNDDDDDDSSDDSSNVSGMSGMSWLSASDQYQYNNHTIQSWIRKQIQKGHNPRDLVRALMTNFCVPEDMSEMMLWRIIAMAINPHRERLKDVCTMTDVVKKLRSAKNIIVLTGAGVSVSCGIPDFRSRDGIYSRLSCEYPNLPDPQAMFDIKFFYQDPRPFFKFAREIFPGQFQPSPSHRFIRQLEKSGMLLRNYTQNIDTLERVAGITKLIECHGSFATASCTRCKFKVDGSLIKDDIQQQRIPVCFKCNPTPPETANTSITTSSITTSTAATEQESLQNLVTAGIFKPDIVFFGEGLPDDFHDSIEADREKCDLLIVIGSSLKVKPVAMIPNWIPSTVPQILINREPLPHMDFDVKLYGDSDVIINQLCCMLASDFESLCSTDALTQSTIQVPKPTPQVTTLGTIVVPYSDEMASPAVTESIIIPPEDDSLTLLLKPTTYAQISARSYIFPGAEVSIDDYEEENDDEEDEDEQDFSDYDDETPLTDANEVIVPDTDNAVLVNETIPPPALTTPITNLSPPIQSLLKSTDHEVAQVITSPVNLENSDGDVLPSPMKRPRIDVESGDLF